MRTRTLAVVTALTNIYQQQTAPRTVTPEQVEEIITRVVDKLDVEPAPEQPAVESSKPKSPTKQKKRRERRSGR